MAQHRAGRGKALATGSTPSSEAPTEGLLEGQVYAAYGRHFEVHGDDGSTLETVRRGKRHDVACGDRVAYARTSEGQAVIESVLARRTLLYRSDAYREKLLAANVTLALIVVAPEPPYNDELLTRCLAGATAAGMATAIILNKMDLGAPARQAASALAYYAELGYAVIPLAARDDVAPLRPILKGELSILVGQSGMGKSTLVNALAPDARARTGEISIALSAGRHTTTHARLYPLDPEDRSAGAIVDSPGLQEFGLHHLSTGELEAAFPEFLPYLGHCRYADCRHRQEPACALKEAAAGNPRRLRRLAYLTRLLPQH